MKKIKSISNLVRSYERVDTRKEETGFIAQELAEVAPEYVQLPEDSNRMQSVNYAKMVVPIYKELLSLLMKLKR